MHLVAHVSKMLYFSCPFCVVNSFSKVHLVINLRLDTMTFVEIFRSVAKVEQMVDV